MKFATNNTHKHIQAILDEPRVEEVGPGYTISEKLHPQSCRATRVGIIGQNGNDGLHYEEMRGKPSPFSGVLLGVVAFALVALGVYQMVNMRSFGFYPDGKCAYEQIEGAKATCPEVMPKGYGRHIISPDWGKK